MDDPGESASVWELRPSDLHTTHIMPQPSSPRPVSPLETPLQRAIAQHRQRLWGLCYRMAGSGADADDWLQDSCERALRHPPADLERDLGPWLTRVTINVCRDRLRQRKHSAYPGPWLPGPLESTTLERLLEAAPSPEARYGQLESLSLTFLQALEQLTPSERAVLILRDVMGLSVQEAAEALSLNPPNVKTTLHRAHQKLAPNANAPKQRTTKQQRDAQQQALYALLIHLSAGNFAALREFVASDLVMLNDGAGQYFAARRPVVGIEKVERFNRNVMRPFRWARACRLNGTPAIQFELYPSRAGVPNRGVAWVDLDANQHVCCLYVLVADEKLKHLSWEPASTLQTAQLFIATLTAALSWRPENSHPENSQPRSTAHNQQQNADRARPQTRRRLTQLGRAMVTALRPHAQHALRRTRLAWQRLRPR